MPTYTILKKNCCASCPYIESLGWFPCQAGLQTLLHSQAPSHPWWTMAWLLKSHNGVHCCGTVGDSHSHSQLSTATCTSQGGVCVSDPHCKGTTIFRPHQTFSRKNLLNSSWRSFPLAYALFPPAPRSWGSSPRRWCIPKPVKGLSLVT